MWNPKCGTNGFYLQNRNRLIGMENRLVVAKREVDWAFGVNIYKP